MTETREAAYERAVALYTNALRAGGAALKALGTSAWHLRPSPDEFHRNVLGIAEFLVAAKAVPPGPCWSDSGVTWPDGWNPRCDLLPGRAGAHETTRPNGGTTAWTDDGPLHGDAPGEEAR